MPEIVVIDERDRGNVLSDPSRNIDLYAKTDLTKEAALSLEGFASNETQQVKLARYILNRFTVSQKGSLLEVGFGTNTLIMETFARSGIPTFGIDGRENLKWIALYGSGSMEFNTEQFWDIPKQVDEYDGIRIFSGDVALMGRTGSALRNRRFGLILFNGSWSSDGCNFSVMSNITDRVSAQKRRLTKDRTRTLEERVDRLHPRMSGDYTLRQALLRQIDQERQQVEETFQGEKYINQGKDAVLEACRRRLVPGGLIGIVSSRYAYRGAGYYFEDLPEEKVEFIDLYTKFTKLGAQRISLVGISQGTFKSAVMSSFENALDQEQNGLVSPAKINFVLSKLHAPWQVPGFNTLARIDALFAEF